MLFGFPFLTVSLSYYAKDNFISRNTFIIEYQLLIIPIIVPLLIFFITSFKKTRFLGQPERYIEFSIPFISILATALFIDTHQIVLYLTLSISFLLVSIEIFFFGRRAVENNEAVIKIVDQIRNIQHEIPDIRIFSNNTEFLWNFLGRGWKVLIPHIFSEKIGTMHIRDVFNEKYGSVNKKVVIPLIKEYGINVLILDTRTVKSREILHRDFNIDIEEKKIIDAYKVLKITHAEEKHPSSIGT